MSVCPLHAWMVGHVWMKWTSSLVSVPKAGLEPPVRALCQHVGTLHNILRLHIFLHWRLFAAVLLLHMREQEGVLFQLSRTNPYRYNISNIFLTWAISLTLGSIIIECTLITESYCIWKYFSREWKHNTTSHFFRFMSSSFSLCHHDEHLCCHLPSRCRCGFYHAFCHLWPPCSSITLHHNTGDHPLHLWAGVHHLWQGQQHLYWYNTIPVSETYTVHWKIDLFNSCTFVTIKYFKICQNNSNMRHR